MKKRYIILILTMVFMIFYSLSVYSQNEGKIIFSNNPVNPDNPENVTTDFKSGDFIYGMALTGDTIKNVCGTEDSKKIILEVHYFMMKPPLYSYQSPSEEFIDFSEMTITGKSLNNKYLVLDIAPEPSKITAYKDSDVSFKKFGIHIDGPVKYTESFSKFKSGKQTLIFKVRCKYAYVASGEMVIEGDDYSGYKTLSGEYRNLSAKSETQKAKMPEAKMQDKKLEKEMIDALKKSQTFKARMNGQIIRLNIIDSDWYIRRNEITGQILHRYIRAAVAIKDAGGTCKVWDLVTFQQDFIGNKFQKTKFDGAGDSFQIKCGNISK